VYVTVTGTGPSAPAKCAFGSSGSRFDGRLAIARRERQQERGLRLERREPGALVDGGEPLRGARARGPPLAVLADHVGEVVSLEEGEHCVAEARRSAEALQVGDLTPRAGVAHAEVPNAEPKCDTQSCREERILGEVPQLREGVAGDGDLPIGEPGRVPEAVAVVLDHARRLVRVEALGHAMPFEHRRQDPALPARRSFAAEEAVPHRNLRLAEEDRGPVDGSLLELEVEARDAKPDLDHGDGRAEREEGQDEVRGLRPERRAGRRDHRRERRAMGCPQAATCVNAGAFPGCS
jgi:hypothetical protein